MFRPSPCFLLQAINSMTIKTFFTLIKLQVALSRGMLYLMIVKVVVIHLFHSIPKMPPVAQHPV